MNSTPKNKSGKIVRTSTSVSQTTWSAPIPPPNLLADYDHICPGAAQIILDMAKNQSNHRMELEQVAIRSNYKKVLRGQIFGLIIGLSGIIGSIFLGYNGHDALAGTIATLSIGSLAMVFVLGRDKQTKSLAEKKI